MTLIARAVGLVVSASCLGALVVAEAEGQSVQIEVTVTGIEAPYGQIGCALHDNADAFPMGDPSRPTVWVPAQGETTVCVFEQVAPGPYAIAIAHDVNGNQRTDTNFLGIPREQWGVSGNVRPSLRAPRFDEAEFIVEDQPLTLTIAIDG